VPDPPSLADVDRIVAVRDGMVRNLQISQAYHELSAALAERVGQGANWCTFAAWASKQAGQTIRQEDFVRHFERLLQTPPKKAGFVETIGRRLLRAGLLRPHTRLGKMMVRIYDPMQGFRRASDAVGRGNLKVFAEIGRYVARMLHEWPASLEELSSFCGGLLPGDPPEGQEYLRRAFRHYYEVAAGPETSTRAQLLLLANVEIGFHEQTRLQPEIEGALDVPVSELRDLGESLRAILWPGCPRLLRGVLAGPLQWLAVPLARIGRSLTHHVITEHFMTLRLPGGEIRLGRDIREEFPPSLWQVSQPELVALLARVEPSGPSPDRSGAWDWSDFSQRMHYIAHVFRTFQEDGRLFQPPFTAEQVAVLKAGGVPAGSL